MERETGRATVQKYLFPPFMTLLIVSIVLWLKQIFPFGQNTIDYYDMGQQIAAFYYHVYDALHGTKSLFYDWYSALGTNMTMNTSGCSSISFFNLLLYFVPRDYILQSLSIFTMVKMACMSLTMFHFLHRTVKSDLFWEYCFSICYGVSGFAMMYYITNQWLDVAVFLPLLIGALWRLLKEEKMMSYIVYLTICLVGSYYQSFMILIFIVLGTGAYYLVLGSKDEKEVQGESKSKSSQDNKGARKYKVSETQKRAVWRLLLGTLAAFGLSAFILIPQLMQTFGSTRFENNNKEGNFYLNIINQVKGAYTTRWWTLLGLSLPLAVILRGIFVGIKESGSIKQYRKSSYIKKDLFFVLMIAMVCLELLFESVNLMWHFGSYVGYPIRNGFIISLMILTAACVYTKRYGTDGQDSKQGNLIYKLILGLTSTAILAGFVIYFYQSRADWVLRSVFHLTALVCGVSFLVYMILLWNYNAALRSGENGKQGFHRAAIINLLLAELLIFAYIMLGKPAYTTGYSEQAEQSGSYIAESNELVRELGISDSTVERIKNPDTELNANYPFVMRHAALSNWTHMIEPSFQQGAVDWGYSIQYMRVLDAGGTAFSDAMIGVKQVISLNELPEELYEEVGRTTVGEGYSAKEYILYNCKYTLPFGTVISGYQSANEQDVTDRFAYQNEVFSMLQDDEPILIETLCKGDGAADAHQTFEIQGKKALYFSGASVDSDEGNIVISVNGKEILVPTIGSPKQVNYPAYFNNNFVCLGVFEDEIVDMELKFLEVEEDLRTEQDECFTVGALDLNLLGDLCDQYETIDTKPVTTDTGLSLTLENVSKESTLLIPVKFDKGFTVEVNGTIVEAEQGYGIFTAVPLAEGDNQIVMKFFPTGMKAGCVISMLTLFVTLLVWFLKKRNALPCIPKLEKAAYGIVWVLFVAAWSMAVIVIYIIPILYAPFALLFG